MAGIPPLAGFFGKLLVLVAVLEKGLYGPAVIAIAVSLISAYYYLRIIKIF
jgi:NADH-quinone oxidoreductase subunit N